VCLLRHCQILLLLLLWRRWLLLVLLGLVRNRCKGDGLVPRGCCKHDCLWFCKTLPASLLLDVTKCLLKLNTVIPNIQHGPSLGLGCCSRMLKLRATGRLLLILL